MYMYNGMLQAESEEENVQSWRRLHLSKCYQPHFFFLDSAQFMKLKHVSVWTY